jgi:hypothetical protein
MGLLYTQMFFAAKIGSDFTILIFQILI